MRKYIRGYQAGITMVASAGNNGEDSGLIEYPAFSPKWGYDLDGDGVWDPVEIRERLMDTAENLGLHPHQQGAGLVRADWALFRHLK